MAEHTYDQGEIIFNKNQPNYEGFEKLRQLIAAEFQRRNKGAGDSCLSSGSAMEIYYNKYHIVSDIGQELSNLKDEKIMIENAKRTLNAMANVKMTGSPSKEYSQYDIIPALTNLYSIVNNWRNCSDTKDGHGCDAACSGLCSGTGKELENGLPLPGIQGKPGGGWYGNCVWNCTGTCDDGCTGNCFGGPNVEISCGDGSCSAVCHSVCRNTCTGGCASDCAGGCNDGCTGTCTSNCESDCHTYCGSGCSGGCSNGCGNNCGTNACQAGCGQECQGVCQYGCFGTNNNGPTPINTGCNGCDGSCQGCQGTCSGTCSSCAEQCWDGCSGSCGNACRAWCSNYCTTTCSGTVKNGAYD